ncbi:MAG: Por secretion system protein [Prevotella sp.]|nr:Por secretion system protein [Prevotella sp.]
MKKILLLLLALTTLTAHAQTGTWHAYMAYSDIQQIVKGGNLLFVRASNGLYTYNLSDHSITTYDKMNALNDCYVTHIAWNPTVKRLIIVYDNSNIDLMDQQGNVINLASLYLKSMTQDKTVNRIDIRDQYAYLSTGFGVMKVDMKRCEVSESYILKRNVTKLGFEENTIYIETLDNLNVYAGEDTPDGTILGEEIVYKKDSQGRDTQQINYRRLTIQANYRGSLLDNLIDPHNWTYTQSLPGGIFDQDLSDYNDNLATVQSLKPGGPKHNHFAFMRFKNNTLYTCGGGYNSAETSDLERPATIQMLSNGEWTTLPDTPKEDGVDGTERSSWRFVDMMSVDVDPLNPSHIFGGSRTGLYEYLDGQLVKYYHKDNSPLLTATTSNNYVLVESVLFDAEGKLWMLQSQVGNSLLSLDRNGEFRQYDISQLMSGGKSLGALQSLYQDSRGLLWFVNNHYETPSFYCYNPQASTMVNSFVHYFNEDGTSFGSSTYYPRHVAEDLDGNIWVSTSLAPMEIENANVWTQGTYVTQPKIPRNDGTNYADYLMNGANISCIVIDGGNRKWMGTKGQGLYLISADNMEQVYHFTTENSPLLSDNIESLAYDGLTGEVYIGTEAGLCSYTSDATTASIEMVEDDVYAFPNPVFSSYQGLITVRGLSRDADVKILTTSGQLVYQGRSNGGTFTWNGCDQAGRRVASGIYMVCTATSTGESGVVCKIAMIK